jgi:hypothetical protein
VKISPTRRIRARLFLKAFRATTTQQRTTMVILDTTKKIQNVINLNEKKELEREKKQVEIQIEELNAKITKVELEIEQVIKELKIVDGSFI